ncbi:MAG: hypothetical protein A3H98_07365 [Bacteroidetes bacterium RIFCSPLOWO2_02_FULL_36_8]|nr:MAG: hypothetical protein A3H98_07365 [Bacteroidetes bacterium RIFCSPLOWO2_02_FULL_36_8]
MDIYILKCSLALLISFAVSLYAIPPLITIALEKKLFDIPNPYKVHVDPIPRLGGLAIFVGFMVSLFLLGNLGQGIQQIIAGCVIIFFIGLKDDLIPISALKKFLGQLLAAGIVMFMGNIRITSFQGFLGIYELDSLNPGLSYILTFVTIIGITNAINLIDGIDGLAGTLIFLFSVTFGLVFLFHNKPYLSIVAFALTGSVLAFLRFNIVNAKIFMGDTGSLLCGFLLSVLAIEFIELKHLGTNPMVAVSVLCLPLIDTIRVFSLRIYYGLSPFLPNRDHVYHRLLDAGFTHFFTTFLLSFFNLFVIAGAFYLSEQGNLTLLLFLIISHVILYLLVLLLRFKKLKELKI